MLDLTGAIQCTTCRKGQNSMWPLTLLLSPPGYHSQVRFADFKKKDYIADDLPFLVVIQALLESTPRYTVEYALLIGPHRPLTA